MREYYYTIDEMVQIIAEYHQEEKIIAEYKEVEEIEILSEDEMTNLFGSTYFNYNFYNNAEYLGHRRTYMYISDYELYQLESGFDPFTGLYFGELLKLEYHNFPGVDYVQPYDVENEDLCRYSFTIEELMSTTSIDEFYLYSTKIPTFY